MRFGIVQIVDGVPGRGMELVTTTATSMEELGFDSYWAPDHVVFFDTFSSKYPHSDDGTFNFKQDQGLLEPIMVLQVAAAATSRLRLGTSVEVITERNPVGAREARRDARPLLRRTLRLWRRHRLATRGVRGRGSPVGTTRAEGR